MVANDRGQLLLIGGVAVAIVVFSTVLFAHSLAVTDGITTTGSADTIERLADREASVGRDLGRLATATRGDDLDGFEARYERALRNYTRTHNRVVATRDGAYLNATLNETASLGTEVNQTGAAPFRSPAGASTDWDLVRDADRIPVFNLTVTDVPGTGTPFTVVVEGDSGGTWAMEVTESSPGAIKTVAVPGDPSVCRDTGDAAVGLVDGTCSVGGTTGTFTPFTETLDAPYTVRIEKGNRAEGTYRLAAVGTFPSGNYGPRDTAPYPVVPAVDTTYDTPSASYNRTVLVEVDDE